MALLGLSGMFLLAFLIGLARKPDQKKHGLARQRLKRLGDRLGDQRAGAPELSILRPASEHSLGGSGSKLTGPVEINGSGSKLTRPDTGTGS